MNNPHLLQLEDGRRVLVNVKRIGARKALATWRGISIYPDPKRLLKINPEHILPYCE